MDPFITEFLQSILESTNCPNRWLECLVHTSCKIAWLCCFDFLRNQQVSVHLFHFCEVTDFVRYTFVSAKNLFIFFKLIMYWIYITCLLWWSVYLQQAVKETSLGLLHMSFLYHAQACSSGWAFLAPAVLTSVSTEHPEMPDGRVEWWPTIGGQTLGGCRNGIPFVTISLSWMVTHSAAISTESVFFTDFTDSKDWPTVAGKWPD